MASDESWTPEVLRCGWYISTPESQHDAESARSLEARETVVGVPTHQWQGSDPPFTPPL